MKIINETPDTMTFEFTREEVGVLRRSVEAEFYNYAGDWSERNKTMPAAEKAVYDYFVEAV